MTRKLITVFGAVALVALLASQVFAKEMTVRGRLQRTVEPGGWVIAAGNQKYLILNAQRFQNERWFAEGNEVEAVGETKPDVMTAYMEGIPFEARTIGPLASRRFRRKSKRVKRSHQSVGDRRLVSSGATGYRDPDGFGS